MEQRARSFLTRLISELHTTGCITPAGHLQVALDEYNRRHWHEMSVELLAAYQDPAVLHHAHELHEHVLLAVRSDISPIVYVKLLHYTCLSLGSTLEKALAVVESAAACLLGQGATQGSYALQCLRASLLLESTWGNDAAVPGGAPNTARKLLEDVEAYTRTLQMHEIEPLLLALLCRARARDFELRQQYTMYYRNSFDIVTYSEKAELAIMEAEMKSLAFKTVVAALLSEEIFNFGKFINFQPFVTPLEQSPEDVWLLQWMRLCNEGDVKGFESFATNHAANVKGVPDLVGAAPLLSRKVRLMALLHLVFYTPFNERTFSFQTVASRCVVEEQEAEPLLLTALAQGIVRGRMDGLTKEVNITWVEPRVLSLQEVKELATHVGRWRQQVENVSEYVSGLVSTMAK